MDTTGQIKSSTRHISQREIIKTFKGVKKHYDCVSATGGKGTFGGGSASALMLRLINTHQAKKTKIPVWIWAVRIAWHHEQLNKNDIVPALQKHNMHYKTNQSW